MENRKLYGFLVGINEYLGDVSPLHGCVADVEAFKSLLCERGAKDGFELIVPRVYTNSEATRNKVIEGLEWLASAGKEDVAIFYYSGHGSQERTPKEFRALEPDGYNETLVCHDSRGEGGYDLADKELRYLLDKVSEKCKHVLVILDCCHSGSGTRAAQDDATSIRLARSREDERPAASYVFASELGWAAKDAEQPTAPAGWGKGKHILLAACRSSETAKEIWVKAANSKRGAFSLALLDTLQRLGDLSYDELIRQVRVQVRVSAREQEPQLEADPEDRNKTFLAGAIAPHSPHFVLTKESREVFWIDGGSVHGIQPPQGGETTVLRVFPAKTNIEEQPLSKSKATVEVLEVEFSRSKVKVTQGQPDNGDWAFIYGLPMPAPEVSFSGDGQAIEAVRRALQSSNQGQPSMYAQIPEQNNPDAPLHLEYDGEQFKVSSRAGRIAPVKIKGFGEDAVLQAVDYLERVGRWITISKLNNPSPQNPNPVHIEVQRVYGSTQSSPQKVKRDKVEAGETIRLEYGPDLTKDQPKLTFRFTNLSNRTQYVSMLDLTERYAITSLKMLDDLTSPFCIELKPGDPPFEKDIYFMVPDELRKIGVSEVKDIVKVIVSTDEFQTSQKVDQKRIDVEWKTRGGEKGATRGTSTTLNRIFTRMNTREAADEPSEETLADWVTYDYPVLTVRPLERIPVPKTGEASLSGIRIQPHPSLNAQIKRVTVQTATRGADGAALPPMLQPSETIQPFELGVTTRSAETVGGESDYSAIEVSGLDSEDFNRETVTPEAPLVLNLEGKLESGEALLASAYDPESKLWLPVGVAEGGGDTVRLEITHLPEPTGTGERSLGSAIRILLNKLVGQTLGLPYTYPRLLVAHVQNGKTHYSKPEEVAEQVRTANRILLFVHGIIGDTLGMAACAPKLSFSQPYDLVLTYDYESVNDGIRTNAADLKKRLKEVGLGQDHGKILHIVAHSMGGLISRYMLERLGGAQENLVQGLVMAGTPNGGSPWPGVKKMVTTLAVFGLNSLDATGLVKTALSGLLAWVSKGTTNLEEMHPGSEVLKELAETEDPKVPYWLIAGDITADQDQKKVLAKIRDKLASAVIFLGHPNDIATTVESASKVAQDRDPKPQMVDIPCDHLSYFHNPTSLEAISQALKSIA